MTWRKTKQGLIIEGEKSDEVERQIYMEMLRDGSSLGQPLQTQESVTADKHTCMKEIKCLKQGQSLNSEMIQSLADTVSGLAPALKGLKGNERKTPRNSAGFVIRKSDAEQSQYANQCIINDSIVPEGLSDSPTKDNSESLIVLEELPINNESERLCSEVKKKIVFADGDHKTNYTVLSELIAEGHVRGQQKLSYAEVLSMGVMMICLCRQRKFRRMLIFREIRAKFLAKIRLLQAMAT